MQRLPKGILAKRGRIFLKLRMRSKPRHQFQFDARRSAASHTRNRSQRLKLLKFFWIGRR